MKKLFAVILIPFFLTSLSVISTEKTIVLTNEEKYQLTSNVVAETTYFDSIPTNPILVQDSNTYRDTALTTVSDTLSTGDTLSIADSTINDSTIPVFELSDGSYIEASRQFIYDDVVISQESISKEYWLEGGFKVYQAPYVTGTKEIKTDLASYSEATVTQKATTYHGTYYKVDGKGWISKGGLSATDNRMEKVQQVLNQKYNKSNYSIYAKQLSTQTTAGISADTVMYSANVAKLAILYYVEEKLQDGTISADDTLKYIDAVNSLTKACDPSGSGKISKTADNKGYTIDDLLKAVAQNSDNAAINISGYYVANQYDDDSNSEIGVIAGTGIDMKVHNMSSKIATNLMEAIYDQDGDTISYLLSTIFDATRISRDIDVQVVHKIGDAYDYKHGVTTIYADESFILSIFTNNTSYDDISSIANDVYAILK